MEKQQIISWLEGLIQAKNSIGQGVVVDYLYGYVDSAKGLLDILKSSPTPPKED